MKNILVIGGSYFVGRLFCILASRDGGFEITAVNRGNCAIRKDRVTELVCDRNDADGLRHRLLPSLEGRRFDALIDFCGYEPGQIEALLPLLKDRIGQYIFVSTASVYAPDDLTERHEDDRVMDEPAVHNQLTDYVYKKLLLEQELVRVSADCGVPYTILRPTVIFGPFNYSPRESYYIQRMVQGQALPELRDAPARFNMVYGLDIAQALMRMSGDSRAYGEIFNLSAPEVITRRELLDALVRFHGSPVSRVPVSEAEAADWGLQISLPTVYDELYSGKKLCDTFDFAYTPFEDAMKKTYEVFRGVYGG